MTTPQIDLVFQRWGEDSGIFFSKPDYERNRMIETALSTSRTWGDFRAALPDGEFASLSVWWANGGEYVYREGDTFRFIDADDLPKFWRNFGDPYVITAQDVFWRRHGARR